MEVTLILTDGIFETGAYGVPSKSQNPIVLGQGGSSTTQCSNISWTCCWHNRLAPFRGSTQSTKVFILTLIFFFISC